MRTRKSMWRGKTALLTLFPRSSPDHFLVMDMAPDPFYATTSSKLFTTIFPTDRKCWPADLSPESITTSMESSPNAKMAHPTIETSSSAQMEFTVSFEKRCGAMPISHSLPRSVCLSDTVSWLHDVSITAYSQVTSDEIRISLPLGRLEPSRQLASWWPLQDLRQRHLIPHPQRQRQSAIVVRIR